MGYKGHSISWVMVWRYHLSENIGLSGLLIKNAYCRPAYIEPALPPRDQRISVLCTLSSTTHPPRNIVKGLPRGMVLSYVMTSIIPSFLVPCNYNVFQANPILILKIAEYIKRCFVGRDTVCVATPLYRRIPGLDEWCQLNCLSYPPNCPPDICYCP